MFVTAARPRLWYGRTMRATVLGIGIGVLAACGGDPLPQGDLTATITRYDYSFDIDSRLAHTKLTATVDSEGNCWTLPNRAQVDGITARIGTNAGDAADSVSLTADSITVCGAGFSAGSELVLELDLTIPMQTLSTSQVGYSITNDADNNKFYYLVSWVNGCDRFGPCDSRPDRFARYAFTITHPAGFVARCPGVISEPSPTETHCEFDHDGGPTYSTFGVAVYPAWTQTAKGKWGSVDVTLYDRAATKIDTNIDSVYHAGFVEFMERTFGPFPFGDQLRVLTAPTYWSGFEHPGNIVLDDLLARQRSAYLHPVAHVLDHEMAHQWAGDQTTIASTYDFVWKEAMAEYLAFVYESTADPPAAAVTASAWKAFSAGARFFPVPGEQPTLFDYYGDVYGPGPMVLFRQLEVLTSRDQVIAALQSVLGKQRALSVDELIAALSTTTGLDLTAYANGWIRGKGTPDWPRFMVTTTPMGGMTQVTVRQTNPSSGRVCKFHVALRGAQPGEEVLVEVNTLQNTGPDHQTMITTPAFAIASTVIDPLSECLAFPSNAAAAPAVHPWGGMPR